MDFQGDVLGRDVRLGREESLEDRLAGGRPAHPPRGELVEDGGHTGIRRLDGGQDHRPVAMSHHSTWPALLTVPSAGLLVTSCRRASPPGIQARLDWAIRTARDAGELLLASSRTDVAAHAKDRGIVRPAAVLLHPSPLPG